MGYDHRVKILIQIYFLVEGSKVLKKADMNVDSFEYEINPDQAAAESAIRWITSIRREFSGMEVYKVVYNTTDITEIVKEIEPTKE